MPAIAIVGALAAYIFIYAGIKGADPRDILVQFLSGVTAPKKLDIPKDVEIGAENPSGKAKKPRTKTKAGASIPNVGARAKMTAIWTQVHARFPKATFLGIHRDPSRGLNQCPNPPRSGCGFSQHNYDNALDIGVPVDSKLGDDIARWLKANRTKLRLRNILWRVPNHHDHIHVDGEPSYCGTPPGKPC
jgi:hypothetical protein